MPLSTKPYKGARDFYPEDKRLMKYMFSVIRQVVESYGYEEYDAPILEPIELYLSKTSEEIVSQQTYSFEDRGGRKVTIRPEMTPTVSRMVAARRQELAYPLRWYSIPNVWRYERPQHGRLREHWQLNVDLFGVEDISAEIEMLQVANSIFRAYGASEDMYEIRVNSRKALGEAITSVGVITGVTDVIRSVDMFEKLSREELTEKLRKQVKNPDKLLEYLTSAQPNDEIRKLIDACQQLGFRVVFVPSLARGFDYYTDIVFEVFDKHPENNRSMFGGGRYDGLVAQFGVEPLPTVGFGMGDVTLKYFLQIHSLLPALKPETSVAVVLAGDVFLQAQQVIDKIRQSGINLSVDLSGRKLDKQLRSADKKGVKYVLVIGEKELSEGVYSLKELKSGASESLSTAEIIEKLTKEKTIS